MFITLREYYAIVIDIIRILYLSLSEAVIIIITSIRIELIRLEINNLNGICDKR